MKTIAICGSMKYKKEMDAIAFVLKAKHGYNVLQCVYNLENVKLTSHEIEMLQKAHYKKIDISDEIYVVDIKGYIGESTKEEIKYARENEKSNYAFLLL